MIFMDISEEERMLKLLEPGAEVIITWFYALTGDIKAIKIADGDTKMLIQLGLNEIRVPYDKLTCSAIESLRIIAPSDLVRFTKDLDEILKQKK
jgi:hypothetical protein